MKIAHRWDLTPRQTIQLQFLVLITLCGSLVQSVFAATVTVSGRKLLVNGQAYSVQGVNYAPTPVGYTLTLPSFQCSGPFQWWTDRPMYIADFQLIHRLGANTIRTFNLMNSQATASQVLEALDQAQANGLYVIMGYAMPTFQAFAGSQTGIQNEVLASVALYKNHPAVLMWVLGNEVNLTCAEGGDCAWSSVSWYNFLDQLAAQVKAIDPNHPVATAEGEILSFATFNMGNVGLQADDAHMTHLDIWGVNAYRGPTFQGLIQSFAVSTMTVKPILMSEFGKDAWHDAITLEDQPMQAAEIGSQWLEISNNLSAALVGSANLIGGTVFEWTDEWWKDSGTGTSCQTHDRKVLFSRPQDTVDPNYQDEWFGITGIAAVDPVTNPNGTVRYLRKAYLTLQSYWNPGAAAAGSAPTNFFSDTVRNFPNPFIPGTTPTKFVAYANDAGTITLSIYDASGQFVASLPSITTIGAGRYETSWDGRNRQGEVVSAGLYYARIEGKSAAHTDKQYRKVVAVK